MNKIGQTKCHVTLDNKILEQVSRYKYLGSWATDDARLRYVEGIKTISLILLWIKRQAERTKS